MRPSQVLDMQADLANRLESGVLDFLIRGLTPTSLRDVSQVDVTEIRRRLEIQCRAGYSFHVQENMTNVAMTRARAVLRDEQTINEFVPPTSVGFMILESPLPTKESWGGRAPIHAITWGPASRKGAPAWTISYWNDSDRAPSDLRREILRQMTSEERQELRSRDGGWVLHAVETVSRSALVGPSKSPYTILPEANAEFDNLTRLVCALWQLMDETISLHAEAHVENKSRRNAIRMRLRPRVTVISLRRISSPTQFPGSGTPLTVRVPVRGHWRTLHRGTLEERKTFVRDHERGPKDAPLSMTRKVYDLNR